MPGFQAVRAKHPFFEVCRTPSLACEVTLEPIDTFPELDASIIFSDILVIPQAIGIEVEMQPKLGPVVPHPISSPSDLDRVLFDNDIDKSLQYVYDAITVTRHKLNGRVPLIGFCGAPWTLFAYMVEGASSKTYSQSKQFIYQYPEAAHKLLQRITDACVVYLVSQVKAGAQMLQVFESNGGELGAESFNEFALPYLMQIPARVKALLRTAHAAGEKNCISSISEQRTIGNNFVPSQDISITVFPRMASQALSLLATSCYDVISLDHTVQPVIARQMIARPQYLTSPIAHFGSMSQWFKPGISVQADDSTDPQSPIRDAQIDHTIATQVSLQGNVDPYVLFANSDIIAKHARAMIDGFGSTNYICNLGHGMLPTHPPQSVAHLAQAIHSITQTNAK